MHHVLITSHLFNVRRYVVLVQKVHNLMVVQELVMLQASAQALERRDGIRFR